jgi:glycosyltransferase involved in cell wall biosynthesis
LEKLVSILIPAYNAERWIDQTIRSALNQTWPNKEVIIVDDGSTDRTLEIARKFECSFVKVVTQENRGGPAARNRAISLAQGELIQWLDHDDLLAPDKIEHQMRRIRGEDHALVLLSGVFSTFYFRHQKAKFTPNRLFCDLSPVEYLLIKFSENTWVHPSVWLVSRQMTDAAGPWLDIRSPDDDGEYYCRVVGASRSIEFVAEAKSYWRVGNSRSMSKTRSSTALEALFFSTVRSIEHLRYLEDSDRSRRACIKFLEDRLLLFLPERPDLVVSAQKAALDLGGQISIPPLKWHYQFVRVLLGANKATKLAWILRSFKDSILSSWDKLLFTLLD